jgi:hypothetical protein
MIVLDILVTVIVVVIFYLMLPKFSKIGSLFDKKIESIKNQNTEIIPEESIKKEDTEVSPKEK